jgi:hypothetical protein
LNEYQIALATGALIVALLSAGLDRAWVWIAAGAASFVASTAYARHGLPLPSLFTALCDAAVCLAIYTFARQRWELGTYRLFQLSVLVSIVFLGMVLFKPSAASSFWYVTALEGINWAVLLLITGTAVAQWAGANGDHAHHSPGRLVHWAQRALFSPETPRSHW